MAAGAIRAGRSFVELFLDDTKLMAGLAKVQRKIGQVGAGMRRLGVIGAGAGIAMAPVVSVFTSFDDAMRMVRATGSATETEFASLTETAKTLGRTTAFTATQVANLMVELARAGFKPREVEQMTAAVLDLARATGTDATRAAEILATTLKTFKLPATDATLIADQMAAAANKSALSLDQLGESFRHVAPDAKRMGLSVKETLSLLGGLAEAGIKGEPGGTTLRRLLTLTGADAAEFEKIFGVAAVDAAGKLRPLEDVLEELGKSLEGMGDAAASAKLYQFFGLLGITGASALGSAADKVRELNEELDNVNGYSRATAKEMDAGLGGALHRLMGAAEGTAIALGQSFAPALTLAGAVIVGSLAKLTEFVNANEEAAAAIGATVVVLIALGLAAGVAGVAMKGFGIITGAVGLVVLAFTTALAIAKLALLAFVSLPVLIGALFIGIVLGAAKASGALDTLGSTFRSIGRIAGEAMGGIMAAIKKGDIGLAFKILTTGLYAGWLELIIGLRGAWYQFTNFFRDAFSDAVLSIRVVFLDIMLSIVNGLNDMAAAVSAARRIATGDKNPHQEQLEKFDAQGGKKLEDEFRKMESQRQPLSKNLAARDKELAEAIAAQKAFDPGSPTFERLTKDIADLRVHRDVADADLKPLLEKMRVNLAARQRLMSRIKAGEQWIDPAPFEQAKKDLAELDRQERDARNKGQQERLDAIRDERDAKLAALREMIGEANRAIAPMPRVAGQLPMAPMPRAAGRPDLEGQLGDAAKGLYQSADFKGALSLGPAATDIGKQQLRKLDEIATTLKNIEAHGPLVFT